MAKPVLPIARIHSFGVRFEVHWRYDQIGIATATAGLGTLVFQAPAEIITDQIATRHLLFAVTDILTGICFAFIPFAPASHLWIDSLLLVSGIAQTFVAPLLGALALALVGHSEPLGSNQNEDF